MNNGIFINVSLNEYLLQNNFFLDQAYLNTKIIYATFFGSLKNINELTNNSFSNLINEPINYSNNNYLLVFDSLISYFVLKGENTNGKILLDNSWNFFKYYKKEFDLYPLNAFSSYFLINNEDIDTAFQIFQDYKNVLIQHFRTSIIYQNLFIDYLTFLLLTGDYGNFNILFKNVLSDFMHFGVKSSYLFLLMEPMIHYSIIKNVFIFDLLSSDFKYQSNR